MFGCVLGVEVDSPHDWSTTDILDGQDNFNIRQLRIKMTIAVFFSILSAFAIFILYNFIRRLR